MTKKSLFFKIYLGIVAGVVLLIAVGAIILSSVLSSYEETRPVHLAEEIFEKYFQAGDYEGAISLISEKSSDYETAKEIAKGLKSRFDGKSLVLYQVSGKSDEVLYAVAAVDKTEENNESYITQTSITSTKIATMSFRKTEESAGWGFKKFEFEKMVLDAKGSVSVSVKVPQNSKLFLNGNEVSQDLIEKTEESPLNVKLPKGVPGIVYDIYKVSGLYSEPTVSAADNNGTKHEVSRSENDGVYTVQLNYDDSLKDKIGTVALKGVENAAAFIQADMGISKVAPYFDQSSAYYYEVKTTPNYFVWDHNGYSFENEEVNEFYQYDENTFSCHVKFTHRLKKTGEKDFIDVVDMTVFLKKSGNNYLIFDHSVR